MATRKVCNLNSIDSDGNPISDIQSVLLTAAEEAAKSDEETAEAAYLLTPEFEETVFSADINFEKFKRLLFEINFDQENRIRALEAKAAITKIQYRNAIKAAWRNL
jgi:hypothetical protein